MAFVIQRRYAQLAKQREEAEAARQAAEDRVGKLAAELARKSDLYTAQLNRNNALWNALAKLPGGVEAARRISKD